MGFSEAQRWEDQQRIPAPQKVNIGMERRDQFMSVETSDECVTFGSSSLGGTGLTGAAWEGSGILETEPRLSPFTPCAAQNSSSSLSGLSQPCLAEGTINKKNPS